MKKKNTCNTIFYSLFLIFLIACSVVFFAQAKESHAQSYVKIRYNGKTYKNTSKKMTVKYGTKTISKTNYKAIVINKSYMAPYTDIFKKGLQVSCNYSQKDNKLTMTANDSTLIMTIGKKKATLNNKSVTMPTAPLSVYYINKKKTQIMVPISYVSKALNFSYKKSGSNIVLDSPMILQCDNVTTYYTGVKGKIFYNHKLYNLSDMPVIKINGNMYAPAEETIKNILGLDYDYNKSSKKIVIANEDTNIELILHVNEKKALRNNTSITLPAEPKIIYNKKTNTESVCLPLASVLKQLNYSRAWNKNKMYYEIQNNDYFSWQKTLTNQQSENKDTNYLYKFESNYQKKNNTGFITFCLSGTREESMKTITVSRNSKQIDVKISKSEYIMDKNQFSNFGEIVKKIDITSKDDAIVLSISCENVADYSYVNQNNALVLNILYSYGANDGSSIDYSLSIPKPEGITIASVSNKDLYESKKFVIYIKGNYVDYFKKNPVVINNSKVRKISIAKTKNNNTSITITTSSLMGYKIYEQDKSFVVKVATPKKIYKNIVVLDAGHGGYDPGAQNKGTNEKDLNFKIIYTLMKNYFSGNAPSTKVYWTRTTDKYITLSSRASFAKKVGADAFISLHMNSASSSTANGTEVYYSVSNNGSSFGGITSQKMAKLFKTQLINDLKTTNRGTKTAAYYVLKHNTVPSILIELGFLSGNKDYANLTNATFQKKAAKSIYTGIVSMFKTYKTGR